MKMLDLRGQRFGKLIVQQLAGVRHGQKSWKCQCDCGNAADVLSGNLRSGVTKSCGCLKKDLIRIDLTGQRFGRLLAKEPVGRRGNSKTWLCQCDCGNMTEVPSNYLRRGITRSCGCLRREVSKWLGTKNGTRHGLSNDPAYGCWESMHDRCRNPNRPESHNYVGRGIVVCERWSGPQGFANFLADLGPRPSPMHSLDRFPNPNGNYEPGNVRWALPYEQQRNRSNSKLTIEKAREIRTRLANGEKRGVLANAYSVSGQTIYEIGRNVLWKEMT
jgi:hypothetical protein